MDDGIIKQEILKILKNNNTWISIIHKELIRRNKEVSLPKLYDLLDEMEKNKLIETETIGNTRLVKLK